MADKARISKDVRNAERKRKRLKKRAALLSNDDIMDILSIRREEKSEKVARAKAKGAKAKAKGHSG